MIPDNVFHFMAYRWDVDKAQALIARRPDEPTAYRVDVKAWWEMLGGAIQVRKGYALTEAVDLTEPVLMVPVFEKDHVIGQMVIDGWHRIFKAYMEGVETLPAYYLTEKEEWACRVSGGAQ